MSQTTEDLPASSVTAPGSKRKKSNTSPNLVTSKKIQLSDSAKKMDQELKKEVSDMRTSFEGILGQILNECKENKNTLATIDKENKERIAENSRQIQIVREEQQLRAVTTDERLLGLEGKVASLIEHGLDPTQATLPHEAEHERDLRTQIQESKSCVTAIGPEGQLLTPMQMADQLSHQGYVLNGRAEKLIVSVSKIGFRATAPWKVKLDSAATAESLLDQSRALHTNQSKEKVPNPKIRLVKYYPPPYAKAAKDFRQMAAMVYDNGGVAKLEYEGTTLTLRAKSREPGGEWVIMKNCEFRPMAVGRMTPQEEESPEMSTARSLMDKVLDNSLDSILSKSLILNTETELGVFKDCKDLLGPVLSDGLIDVRSSKSNRSKYQYTLLYETRAKALEALAKYNTGQAVTGIGKETSTLAKCLPVVALTGSSS